LRQIYLASASPRRVELLGTLGVPFEQRVSTVAESLFSNLEPADLAESLALAKARDVAGREGKGLVIGADTIVVHQGQVLGKPVDREDAMRMLRLLNGSQHEVISGVAVVDADKGREKSGHEVTIVSFRLLSEEQLKFYVATGNPWIKRELTGFRELVLFSSRVSAVVITTLLVFL
jgi:septum formation protein